MRFVDEVTIEVRAGNGGAGCLSFLRLKNMPRGGPDGGDGGDGGDVILQADAALNTLVDFRFQPRYAARSGESGARRERFGARGADKVIMVPVGTTVMDVDTDEVIADMTQQGQRLVVARGGHHGLGNARFKSSTNRAPRRTTPGYPGEVRNLRLHLKLIADVGLLGAPNAGKSSLIRQLSAARPKVADYPFTTTVPNLGVVRAGALQSFVLADVPGLIAGAAEGAGLGTRFLRHLSRTRLLWQLVDCMPVDGSDPVETLATISAELARYSPTLAARERFLVINKIDLLAADARSDVLAHLTAAAGFEPAELGVRVFMVSAETGEGTAELALATARWLAEQQANLAADEDLAAREAQRSQTIAEEVATRAALERNRRRAPAADADADDDNDRDDDDDDGVEVVYVE